MKKQMIFCVIILVLLVTNISFICIATNNNGSLSGMITSTEGILLSNVKVTITCGYYNFTTLSNEQGHYYLENIPIVDCYWNVTVYKYGYNKINCELSIDENTVQDFVLSLYYDIIVDDDGSADYVSIQDAINDAKNGDKIFVHSGIYFETIIINKSISLIGENMDTTIIDGINNYNSDVLISFRSNVIRFSDFTVRNCCRTNNSTAIELISAYNKIKSNNLINNTYGIKVRSILNSIENNYFLNNLWGIHGSCFSINIINNEITFPEKKYSMDRLGNFGIYLFHSKGNIISKNIIKNYNCGIRLTNSNENSIINNECQKNENGIYLFDSSNNIIKNNIMNEYQNSDLNGVGIDIQNNSNNNEISNNDVQGFDSGGMFLVNSYNNNITNNNVINNNGFGIIASDSYNNSIHENNIFYNRRNAFFMCSNNSWDNNYWGKEQIFPKLILGYTLKSLFGKNYRIYLLHFDFHPAKEPYEILL